MHWLDRPDLAQQWTKGAWCWHCTWMWHQSYKSWNPLWKISPDDNGYVLWYVAEWPPSPPPPTNTRIDTTAQMLAASSTPSDSVYYIIVPVNWFGIIGHVRAINVGLQKQCSFVEVCRWLRRRTVSYDTMCACSRINLRENSWYDMMETMITQAQGGHTLGGIVYWRKKIYIHCLVYII